MPLCKSNQMHKRGVGFPKLNVRILKKIYKNIILGKEKEASHIHLTCFRKEANNKANSKILKRFLAFLGKFI